MVGALCVNFEDMCEDYGAEDNSHCSNHPENELTLTKKIQQLRQAVRWFAYGAKYCDESCTGASKNRSNDRKASERLFEEERGEGGVEYETGL